MSNKLLITLSFIVYSSSFVSAQTWSALGSGVSDSGYLSVGALTTYNGNLIAGAGFNSLRGYPANLITQWNGIKWDSLKGGVSQRDLNLPWISALSTYKGNLIAGGHFLFPGANLAQWNGNQWSDSCGGVGLVTSCLGCSPAVSAFTTYGGNLIVGGVFNRALNYSYNPTVFGYIAQRKDTTWSTLNGGMSSGPNVIGEVSALTVYNGKLIAGGWFDSAGGIRVNNIASWNGTTWSSLGSGISGINSWVNALINDNGYLIAAGKFDSAGGVPAKNIAAWDGVSWHPLGSGISGTVYALALYNNYLVAGGSFTIAGGNPANNIAEWSNSKWYPLGLGIGNTVYAMTIYDSSLVVGGYFTTAGGNPANNIAQWKQPLGIEELKTKSEEVKLYPNPNNGSFNLSIRNYELRIKNYVEIYNMLGEKVYAAQCSMRNAQFSMEQPSGIYLFRVITETGELLGEGKFVIEK